MKKYRIEIDSSKKYQRIDGFGVNINSKYWDEGRIIPVLDLLIDDLGATLFRLDAYGKSNWIDPESKYNEKILNEKTYREVYNTPEFKNALSMCRYLNSKDIEPYITLSGVVPVWMCGKDGMTLQKYSEFSKMCVSYLKFLKENRIKFKLFGPLNETDLGPPEGPKVSPEEFVKVIEVLDKELSRNALNDIRLVVPEQAMLNLDYIKEIFKSKKLKNKIAVFGFHCYGDFSSKSIVRAIRKSVYKDVSIWMTEYGDLDQTGEKEWYLAWIIFERLLRFIGDGMNGGIYWDAYDNYHDHDDAWTIYGLIRNARKIYTPKKRFYAVKQIYSFVRPGFYRVETNSCETDLKVVAFTDKENKNFTVVGMNKTDKNVLVNISLKKFGLPLSEVKAGLYITNSQDNCVCKERVDAKSKTIPFTYDNLEITVPPETIFTFTNFLNY